MPYVPYPRTDTSKLNEVRNNLKEFTKEDWDTLFPIKLVEHQSEWKTIFEKEKQNIIQSTSNQYWERIEHFGSSSIPDIKSKPYIDILIEVPRIFLFNDQFIKNLERIGYTCLTEPNENDDSHNMILVKGYNTYGTSEQIFHIHACPTGHSMLKQIEFRDFLIANPDRAKEYENLKVELASQYKNDRSGYRMAKSEFITDILEIIKKKSKGNNI